MLNNFQNVNFSGNSFYISNITNLAFFKYFNSNLFSSNNVFAYLNFAESTLTNWLAKNVLSNFSFMRL